MEDAMSQHNELDRALARVEESAALSGGSGEVSEIRIAIRHIVHHLRALDSASSSLPSSGAAPSRVSYEDEIAGLLLVHPRNLAEEILRLRGLLYAKEAS
jgi:hypothetical protein